MSDDAKKAELEIARLDAERKKLDAETAEIEKRLRQGPLRGRIFLQVIVGAIVASALVAAWVIGYLQPILETKQELADLKNQLMSVKQEMLNQENQRQKDALQKANDSVKAQQRALKQAQADNERLERVLIQKVKDLETRYVELLDRQRLSESEKASLLAGLKGLKKDLSQPGKSTVRSVKLRSQPRRVESDEISRVIDERGFSLPGEETRGDFVHQYVTTKQGGVEVVEDKATGLMWQKTGSTKTMPFEKALDYVARLNRDGYAGFSDWRLPTLEELVSLVEPTQKNGYLYIDARFDDTQRWIWSADKFNDSQGWGVVFYEGKLYVPTFTFPYYVRAVRAAG